MCAGSARWSARDAQAVRYADALQARHRRRCAQPRRGCRGVRASTSRNGTSRRSRHPLGRRADRHRRRRRHLSRARAASRSARDRIIADPREVVAPRAGHHHRLVVRQEIPARARRRACRLGSDSGGARRRAARDQVADHPAAGTGGADRRRATRCTGSWSIGPSEKGVGRERGTPRALVWRALRR